jgi:hypothetical protein
MSGPKFIDLDGGRYLWRDIVQAPGAKSGVGQGRAPGAVRLEARPPA